MRFGTWAVIGVGALATLGCPNSQLQHIVGVGGGGGGGNRLLVFVAEPSTAHVGAFITPAIQVAVEDTLGVVDTTVHGGVTMALSTNPTGAVLSGSTTIVLTAGVATFSDLTINLQGTYVMSASSAGLSTGTSTSFDIIP
ncbi:MAG TPA: hypothetical protein VNG35_10465 [Gemmatimonadales bacterium]|nr:hypothetical protein [Gemmatimonadales bacterium]